MGSSLSIIIITVAAFNVKFTFAECKCERTPDIPEGTDQEQCMEYKRTDDTCTWHLLTGEVAAGSATAELTVQPDFTAVTPYHCVFTAVRNAAKNLGKLDGAKSTYIGTGTFKKSKTITGDWNADVWNQRANAIDQHYRKLEGYIPLHGVWKVETGWGMEGLKPVRVKQMTLKSVKEGKGAFRAPFGQMMLRTVGLNYGCKTDREYPLYYSKGSLEFSRGKTHWDEAGFKKLLDGTMTFFNSQNEEKPMVALVIGINGHPWNKKGTSNHAVTVVSIAEGENKHWFYLDNNAQDIQQLNDEGQVAMTNVYPDPKHGDIISDNTEGAKPPDHGWEDGYLVDPSTDLGTNIDVVAKWLYEKCMIRPTRFVDSSSKDDCGGAINWRVVVEDKEEEWDAIKAQYTAEGMDKFTTPKKASIKPRVIWQAGWGSAHMLYGDIYDLEGNNEEETDQQKEYVPIYKVQESQSYDSYRVNVAVMLLSFAGIFVVYCLVCVAVNIIIGFGSFEFGKYRQQQEDCVKCDTVEEV